MKKIECSMALSSLILSMALGVPGQATAAGMTKISGTITAKNVKGDVLPISAPDGDLFLLEEFQGVNKNTGKTDYLEGAEVDNKDVAALMHGSGPQHGYITFKKGDDQVEAKWAGSVKTVIGKDGQRQVSFSGKWEHTKGVGKYAGAHGHGTYQGHFTSPTEYVVYWKGEY